MSAKPSTLTENPDRQLYVGVGAVVDDGTVLFVRRRAEAVPEYDQKWELPGGKIEIGEIPEVAIEREVREETGLDVSCTDLAPFTYSKTIPIDGVRTHVVVFCARCTVAGSAGRRPTDHEGLEPIWLQFDRIPFDRVIPGSREFALWCLRKSGWEDGLPDASVYELDLERPASKQWRTYRIRIDYTDDLKHPFTVTGRWSSKAAPTVERYRRLDEAVTRARDTVEKKLAKGYRVSFIQENHPLRSWIVRDLGHDPSTLRNQPTLFSSLPSLGRR